jgi:hypothetical protein
MKCQGNPHAHRATRRNLGKRMTIRARISGNHAGSGSSVCVAWQWRKSGLHIPTRMAQHMYPIRKAKRLGFSTLRSVAERQRWWVVRCADSRVRS